MLVTEGRGGKVRTETKRNYIINAWIRPRDEKHALIEDSLSPACKSCRDVKSGRCSRNERNPLPWQLRQINREIDSLIRTLFSRNIVQENWLARSLHRNRFDKLRSEIFRYKISFVWTDKGRLILFVLP